MHHMAPLKCKLENGWGMYPNTSNQTCWLAKRYEIIFYVSLAHHGLPLQTEAPAMTPNAQDFWSLLVFSLAHHSSLGLRSSSICLLRSMLRCPYTSNSFGTHNQTYWLAKGYGYFSYVSLAHHSSLRLRSSSICLLRSILRCLCTSYSLGSCCTASAAAAEADSSRSKS